MDELLIPYANMIKNNEEKFLADEKLYFANEYSEEEKTMIEYTRTAAFFHDKLINEAYYESNQENVIQETLETIKELYDQKEYLLAQYVIVALQLLLGMDVKLNKILYYMVINCNSISEFIDKDKFLGKHIERDKNGGFIK